jgi:hypothetical protein
VITIKYINKLLLILISFFIFNLNEIDSNSDKILLYDIKNTHNENKFKIYFKNYKNVYDLDKSLQGYRLEIISYIIDDKEYYAKDSFDLINKYTNDKSKEEKIYYEINGINIDGIVVKGENIEIIELAKREKIY